MTRARRFLTLSDKGSIGLKVLFPDIDWFVFIAKSKPTLIDLLFIEHKFHVSHAKQMHSQLIDHRSHTWINIEEG